jgi:hypothetical protein
MKTYVMMFLAGYAIGAILFFALNHAEPLITRLPHG